MKGTVLDYSVRTNEGIISGDDNRRYSFKGTEWRVDRPPSRGMTVDFASEDGSVATSIYTSAAPDSDKTKIVAGLLAILLGGLGIHKFYLGYTTEGVWLIAATVVSSILVFAFIGIFLLLAIGAVCLVEGVIYLTKTDEEFHQTYIAGSKPWF